eukprot:TRINITY_DN1336_c0_g3_i1.p1 TRINITY_DN1336_c0_g3~~TRINITY_DN1336_c0_g3_i1.p1  ORF type:complete len:666 (+),score=161.83 TRINITY_DN1336_c0_g3_i1:596-2593(+)
MFRDSHQQPMNLEEYNLCMSSSLDLLDECPPSSSNSNSGHAINQNALARLNYELNEPQSTSPQLSVYGYPFSAPSISPSLLHRPQQSTSPSSMFVPPTVIASPAVVSSSPRPPSSSSMATRPPMMNTSFPPPQPHYDNGVTFSSTSTSHVYTSSNSTASIEQTEYYQSIKATFDELSRESVKIVFPKIEEDASSSPRRDSHASMSPTHSSSSPYLLPPSSSSSSHLLHPSKSPSPNASSQRSPTPISSFPGTMSLDHFHNLDVEIVSERKTHERGFMILAPKIRYSRRSLNIELPLFVLRKGKDEEGEWEDVTHHFKGKHVSYLEDAKNTRRDQAHKEGKSERRGEFSIGMVHPLNVKLSHAGRWWLVIESQELAEMIDFEMKTLTEPRGLKKKNAAAANTPSNKSPAVSSPSLSPPPPTLSLSPVQHSPVAMAPPTINNYQSIIQTTFNTVLPVTIFPGHKRMRGDEDRLMRPEDLWNSYFEGADYQTSVERFIEFWETIDDSFQRNYKKIVEHYFSQPIARKHFLRFVACFGPIQGSAERLLDLYKCEVFWELGTTEACRKFMQSKPPYHFIVRRSYDNNQDHHFVLAVSQPSAEHAVAEYRITRVFVDGKSWLTIPKAVKEADSRFESFCAMVGHFAQRWKPIYNPMLPGRIEETISNILLL